MHADSSWCRKAVSVGGLGIWSSSGRAGNARRKQWSGVRSGSRGRCCNALDCKDFRMRGKERVSGRCAEDAKFDRRVCQGIEKPIRTGMHAECYPMVWLVNYSACDVRLGDVSRSLGQTAHGDLIQAPGAMELQGRAHDLLRIVAGRGGVVLTPEMVGDIRFQRSRKHFRCHEVDSAIEGLLAEDCGPNGVVDGVHAAECTNLPFKKESRRFIGIRGHCTAPAPQTSAALRSEKEIVVRGLCVVRIAFHRTRGVAASTRAAQRKPGIGHVGIGIVVAHFAPARTARQRQRSVRRAGGNGGGRWGRRVAGERGLLLIAFLAGYRPHKNRQVATAARTRIGILAPANAQAHALAEAPLHGWIGGAETGKVQDITRWGSFRGMRGCGIGRDCCDRRARSQGARALRPWCQAGDAGDFGETAPRRRRVGKRKQNGCTAACVALPPVLPRTG